MSSGINISSSDIKALSSHLELLPGNEVYRYVFELVNALARMLVKTTIA